MREPNLPTRLYFSILFILLAALSSCKWFTPPDDHIECPDGYHLCGEDSNECCLDTTSHNFIWEVDTLGKCLSELADVAIIDDDDIWAVGQIDTDDSTYNALHWNGSEWQLMQIGFVLYDGQIGYGAIKSVFAFSRDDVWFFTGFGSYAHWDGELWESAFVQEHHGIIQRIWGTSASNLFFIGTNGNITHYDGVSFKEMDSGTTVNLRSITGTADGRVFVSGHDDRSESVVLEYNGTEWSEKYRPETPSPGEGPNFLGRIYRVFVWEDTLYVCAEAGLWKSDINTGEGTLLSRSAAKMGIESAGIGGNGYADIMIIDAYGWVTHFNGQDWKNLNEIYHQFERGEFDLWSMRIKGNVVVAVGDLWAGAQAFIMRGYRL